MFAPFDQIIMRGRQVIDLYFGIELPKGYEAKIEPRSGYSAKGFAGYFMEWNNKVESRFDCDVLVGKIDSDYRGSVGVIVNNRDCREFLIKAGQRIAQLTIYKVEEAEFAEVDELSDTERGTGGFGHSGE